MSKKPTMVDLISQEDALALTPPQIALKYNVSVPTAYRAKCKHKAAREINPIDLRQELDGMKALLQEILQHVKP